MVPRRIYKMALLCNAFIVVSAFSLKRHSAKWKKKKNWLSNYSASPTVLALEESLGFCFDVATKHNTLSFSSIHEAKNIKRKRLVSKKKFAVIQYDSARANRVLAMATPEFLSETGRPGTVIRQFDGDKNWFLPQWTAIAAENISQ